MTYQGDPGRPTRRPTSMNREGEGWGWVPIAFGVLVVILIGFLLLGPRNRSGMTTSQRSDAPQSSTNSPGASTSKKTPVPQPGASK